jgi:DNA mismatch endonuclease (patch repair protein)
MPDRLSKEARSRVMSGIRSKDTGPELALRKGLHAAGVRGWRCHVRSLPGSPDLAFTRARLAVFCDGAFWHGHPEHFRAGRSGTYWDEKIARTQERDRNANAALTDMDWVVLRFWDFEIKSELERCVSRTACLVASRRVEISAGDGRRR